MSGSGRPQCRHCGREPATRPRGLGWACFKDLAIRGQYPPVCEKYGRRGSGTEGFGAVPAWPTTYLPGTPGKQLEMANRAARGEQLFHPADAAG